MDGEACRLAVMVFLLLLFEAGTARPDSVSGQEVGVCPGQADRPGGVGGHPTLQPEDGYPLSERQC